MTLDRICVSTGPFHTDFENGERVSKPALSPVVDILEALKASLARQRQPHSATPQKVSEERGLRRKRGLTGRPLIAAGRKIG